MRSPLRYGGLELRKLMVMVFCMVKGSLLEENNWCKIWGFRGLWTTDLVRSHESCVALEN